VASIFSQCIKAVSAAALAAACLFGADLSRAEVEITGVGDEILGNVRAYLGLDEFDCETDERRIRQEYQGATPKVSAALQAYGFYASNIRSELTFNDDCWLAQFAIEAGEPVRLRNLDVSIEGAAREDAAFRAALEAAGFEAGSPLRHARYDALKRRLSDLARDRGYTRATFTTNRLDIYPDEFAADIVLHFESGPRYTFGEVQLDQDVLSDLFVRSYIDFRPGDPYFSRELTALYVSLSDSGYFETVDVRPMPANHETQTIPVTITLTPAPRRLISYGVGFSSDTGPRVRFGRNNRRWNDRGHQFGTNAQISPVVSEFTLNYRFPYGDPRYEWVSFDAGAKREKTDTSESKSLEVGARRVRENPGGWTRTQMLNAAVEDFSVGDQIGRSRLLMPGMEWSRIRADNTLRPSRGSKLALEVRGASDTLGSDTSFVQTVAEAKLIRSVAERSRFILRTKLGITSEDSFEDLPPSVRFFGGGDDSVRGYGFETLGPVNQLGEVIGGSNLVTASFEYEYLVRPRWSVAFFVDTGNAFNGTDIDAKTGAGIGARWRSPLGPIRFDLAAPLDDPDRSVRVHVNLGPDL
jgi:translocation and assembly module TamA